ncbi:Ground-like domain-containing protein [Aphelenchoides besseyi]|nr:Ground-like domain-containing protein [Aphelenchoides besseyi]
MTSQLISLVFLLLPLTCSSFLLPPASSGGCCCSAPAASPSACGSSCGGSFGGSNYYSSIPSSGYASASASYAQPQVPSYVSAGPVQASYVQSQPAPSYQPIPSYVPQPSPKTYQSAPQPSYQPAPQPNYQPAPVAQPSSSYTDPIPPPPANYEQVLPSTIQRESQYAEGGPERVAASSLTQKVEDEEAAAKAELSAVVANATLASEPSPPIDISLLQLTNDTECNSEELREIIKENTSEDLNTSKRLIQVAAEQKFGGRFDVICAASDFSYLSNTELWCQHTVDPISVSCYVYRQL